MSVANTSRTNGQAIMSLAEGNPRVEVNPPRIITLTGGSDNIYDTRGQNDYNRWANEDPATSDPVKWADPFTALRIEVINLDAAPVKLVINGDVTAGNYHYILKAATSDKAGDGGVLELRGMSFQSIEALGTAGKQLSVVIYSTR